MPTVLVTGAGGFLGGHLVQELLRREYRVRAFVRPTSSMALANPQSLTRLPITIQKGDICQPSDVMEAAQGCQFIIHAAALTQVNPARSRAIWAVNEGGTANVIQAGLAAGVQRLVYVGTANVFGFGTQQQPGTETFAYAGQHYGLDYMDSKVAATTLVQRAGQEQGLPAVLVHPTFMLGPVDANPTSNTLLLAVCQGQLPGYSVGGKNYVHVRDVAMATVNALTQGRVGESYILGNQNLNYHEAFRLIADLAGVLPPRWPIPPALAWLYGSGCDLKTRLTGKPARVNAAMIAVASDGHYFSAQKAIAELSLPQTPITQAIGEALAWFRENRYL